MSKALRRWRRMPATDKCLAIIITIAVIAVGAASGMGMADSLGMLDVSKLGRKPA